MLGRGHRYRPQENEMPTQDQIVDALRERMLEAITSRNMTSETLLTLAEAYAWLVAPDQAHGPRKAAG
jgi:hypothetical protein